MDWKQWNNQMAFWGWPLLVPSRCLVFLGLEEDLRCYGVCRSSIHCHGSSHVLVTRSQPGVSQRNVRRALILLLVVSQLVTLFQKCFTLYTRCSRCFTYGFFVVLLTGFGLLSCCYCWYLGGNSCWVLHVARGLIWQCDGSLQINSEFLEPSI